MQQIPLQAIPRQTFNTTLDGIQFKVTLVAIENMMYATILANNVAIISGSRCCAGYGLIPYRYLEGLGGNFAFATNNFELPWWEQFGVTQQLIYASPEELANVRAGNVLL